jgi:hypothetical protein
MSLSNYLVVKTIYATAEQQEEMERRLLKKNEG